jgi:hypothetical protein
LKTLDICVSHLYLSDLLICTHSSEVRHPRRFWGGLRGEREAVEANNSNDLSTHLRSAASRVLQSLMPPHTHSLLFQLSGLWFCCSQPVPRSASRGGAASGVLGVTQHNVRRIVGGNDERIVPSPSNGSTTTTTSVRCPYGTSDSRLSQNNSSRVTTSGVCSSPLGRLSLHCLPFC